MSSSAKMRKLSVGIDADLKASFEDTPRGIGLAPPLRDEELRLPDRARGGHPPSAPSTPASRQAARPR